MSQTYCLNFLFFLLQVYKNLTDKSMKMDLIYRKKELKVERVWTGMLCWFRRSGERLGTVMLT